ncbi:MAG TPA: 4'-phosphopantetheinyl transferase superfamily protein [Mucilaginibacter sp.]|jgi:phosphopantetheine--protein transferase-like protein|nr:4'-phosphopantetheinyl transferase superfamily protein [Mucilaginibacter sp.]
MENQIEKSVELITAGKKFAIGNDLVFLPNFDLSFTELFKNKAYSPDEIAYCEQFSDSLLRYASTWAAKEAVYKALKQLEDATLGWKKIEIIRKKNAGEPQVLLHNNTSDFKISLTISHDGDYVWAIALVDAAL